MVLFHFEVDSYLDFVLGSSSFGHVHVWCTAMSALITFIGIAAIVTKWAGPSLSTAAELHLIFSTRSVLTPYHPSCIVVLRIYASLMSFVVRPSVRFSPTSLSVLLQTLTTQSLIWKPPASHTTWMLLRPRPCVKS